MLKQTLIILLCLFTFLPSDKADKKGDKSDLKTLQTHILTPTIPELLKKALTTNTLEFDNTYQFDSVNQFLFFKSGQILDCIDTNAFTVNCRSDTTYSIKLYSLKDHNWQLVDSMNNLEAFPWRFSLTLNDFNFDGQIDIYIQVSATNGWSLSRGHLLLIDPRTKKLEFHKETEDFANMIPDQNTKTIFTEEWQGYNSDGNPQLTILTNKWVKGRLKTISKRDTTLK